MSLGCARCGHCCDPVVIDFHVWAEVVAEARSSELLDADDNRLFIARAMRPVGAFGESVELECSYFDREHRQCTAYEARPPMCRDYPWYDDDRAELSPSLYPECSYLLDVPPADRPEGARPLIPLTVLRAARPGEGDEHEDEIRDAQPARH